MSRNPQELKVFHLADGLVIDIYNATKQLPPEERYGLQAQIRRAAVSAATNIVEGCARRSQKEYVSFCNIAAGSACETRYLLQLANRLGFLDTNTWLQVEPRCTYLAKGLFRLIERLEAEAAKAKSQNPKA